MNLDKILFKSKKTNKTKRPKRKHKLDVQFDNKKNIIISKGLSIKKTMLDNYLKQTLPK